MLELIAPKQLPLTRYEKKLSPHGIVEEGVIEKIFEIIQPQRQFCVELGAGDGKHFSFTRNLIEKYKWGAFLVEGNFTLASKLYKHYENNSNVKTLHSYITAENIEQLFQVAGVPSEIDFLCIDIDGNDAHIWSALKKYTSNVVCIEYNASYGAEQDFCVDYNPKFSWSGDDYFGASFSKFLKIAQEKEMSLIHCSSMGDNLFFVKNEFQPFFEALNSPHAYYQIPQYGKFGRSLNGKGHPASKQTTPYWLRLFYKIRYYAMTLPRKFVYRRSPALQKARDYKFQ